MPCIEPLADPAGPRSTPRAARPGGRLGALTLTLSCLLLSACGMKPAPSPEPPARPGAGPAPGSHSAPAPAAPTAGGAPAGPPTGAPGGARPALPPAGHSRSWAEYQRRAAQRLVQANPERSHLGPVVQPLLAIPVLDIDLNADGSVRRVQVKRHPSQARDTVQLAIDAVHRAAPFGAVGHLPRPWTLTETFLFDEQRRFKPRTLDD